jgi:hypothetical protein
MTWRCKDHQGGGTYCGIMMFCPDCAAELDDVAMSEPCPGCGGHRRSANAQAASATARIAVPDARAVAHSHLADGAERIDVQSRQFRSSSHAGPGADRQSFEGRSPRNEEDVSEVCAVLRDALYQDGQEWGAFKVQEDRVNDVDAVAHNDTGRLSVQVARAEQDAWGELGRTGQADRSIAAAGLASAVLRVIENKAQRYPPAQRKVLLLALDAIRAPGYTQRCIVDVIRDQYTEQIAQFGFAAVWLVGPTSELTYRLA